jgi:hypothetical protein
VQQSPGFGVAQSADVHRVFRDRVESADVTGEPALMRASVGCILNPNVGRIGSQREKVDAGGEKVA